MLKKDKIKRRLSIGRIKTEDERLVERVLESIKSYLLDIERSLNKPIREYSTQYIQLAEAVKLGEKIFEIFKVEVDAYVAIFVDKQMEISSDLHEYSGINDDTKEFLIRAKVRLEEYKSDIEFILTKR